MVYRFVMGLDRKVILNEHPILADTKGKVSIHDTLLIYSGNMPRNG